MQEDRDGTNALLFDGYPAMLDQKLPNQDSCMLVGDKPSLDLTELIAHHLCELRLGVFDVIRVSQCWRVSA
jgi:hypothetical protein